jgi:hypothetical protein
MSRAVLESDSNDRCETFGGPGAIPAGPPSLIVSSPSAARVWRGAPLQEWGGVSSWRAMPRGGGLIPRGHRWRVGLASEFVGRAIPARVARRWGLLTIQIRSGGEVFQEIRKKRAAPRLEGAGRTGSSSQPAAPVGVGHDSRRQAFAFPIAGSQLERSQSAPRPDTRKGKLSELSPSSLPGTHGAALRGRWTNSPLLQVPVRVTSGDRAVRRPGGGEPEASLRARRVLSWWDPLPGWSTRRPSLRTSSKDTPPSGLVSKSSRGHGEQASGRSVVDSKAGPAGTGAERAQERSPTHGERAGDSRG